MYVGKLTAVPDGWQSYVIFIVRDDRPADFSFRCSDNTWQAYNRWPSQFSLYDDGKHDWYWGGDVQVSFNRPYGKYCQIFDAPLSTGSGEFLLVGVSAGLLDGVAGLRRHLHLQPRHARDAGRPAAGQGFLERRPRRVLDDRRCSRTCSAAVQAGVNVAFLSGNTICGRIEFDPACRAFERVGVFGPPGGMRDFENMKIAAITNGRMPTN